ncbi:XRE family transcriptional regulator [Streptomyces botrytidirepellens]|uniref:XRE family transcriptional regulator n=1 Tax=Streptomyces botrytidirepellens TaxID=2486417 RepID=A0A3M8X6J6_9ACTN|nr:XRE family transcriptional regulator [Streptomyces botrytidirepellens]
MRRWLTGVLREHAAVYNDHHDVWEGDWGYVDRADHPVWALLGLSPFSRRLRLLQDATAKSGAGLGRAIGVGAHQLGHWAAGRSRPGEAERRALAAALGIHPGWLDARRDDEPDVQLYRFRSCPCEKPTMMTRGSLGPEEPDWYGSAAEQGAAVHWCDACGQPWLKDTGGWLLPLPPGEERIPGSGALADGSHPAIYVHHRSLAEAWPPVLWRPPHHPLKRTQSRTAYQVPALLVAAPQPLSSRPAPAVSHAQQPVGWVRPEQRVAAHAAWCPSCRALLDAPVTDAGGRWVLLHRSQQNRSLSTWAYPSKQDALHAAAHLAMIGLTDDAVARDLFADQAHAQVLARYLELHPETDVFEVAELVPMRADQF